VIVQAMNVAMSQIQTRMSQIILDAVPQVKDNNQTLGPFQGYFGRFVDSASPLSRRDAI